MEFKDHLRYLKKYAVFIILFGIGVGALAGFISWQRPVMYKAVQSYELQLVNRSTTQDYQYGSYYDLKGAEIFTQHLMGLLRDPAVISEIYTTAGVSYEITNLDHFTNQFRTEQASAQGFTATFSQYQKTDAERIAAAMTTILTERTSSAVTQDNQASLFTLHANTPVVVLQVPSTQLSTVAGLLVGWIGALSVVYLKRYLVS